MSEPDAKASPVVQAGGRPRLNLAAESVQDFRFGWRLLRRNPLFALVASLTLALGIGVNTAIFSVVYGLLMRPLPYPEPQRIVQLCSTFKGESDEMTVTAEELQFLRDHNQSFQSFGAYTPIGFNAAFGGEYEHVNGLHISHDYLDVLRVRPILGRNILPEEDRGDGTRVALLGHDLWQRKTGGDPGILGRSITLDGVSFTVIGVLPPRFERISTPFTHGENEIWVPLALVAKTVAAGQNVGILGRLANGLTADQVKAQIHQLTEAFRERFPDELPPQAGLELVSFQSRLGNDQRTMVLLLFGAAGFVLLIACANVASLLLSRAEGRRREVAIRMAMGASRARLYRQFIRESTLLSLLGTVMGIGVAAWALKLLLAFSPTELPRVQDIHLDGWALAFSAILALLAGVGFGLAPAMRVAKTNIRNTLQENAGTGGHRQKRARSTLVVAEVALSLILLTGSALLIQTFQNVLRQDPGIQPHDVLSTQVWLHGPRYDSTAAVAVTYEQAIAQLQSSRTIVSAAVVAGGLPLERGGTLAATLPGRDVRVTVAYRMVTPGYLDAFGIPLRLGRAFTSTDTERSAPVALINATLARKLFQETNPLGQRILLGKGDPPREIIGVVGDVRSQLDQPAGSAVMIPLPQAPFELLKLFESWFPTHMVVRSHEAPATTVRVVEQALRRVDATAAVGRPRTMDQVLAASLSVRRFQVVLLSSFAVLALLLAAIGIYGVIDESVTTRTREIGIRKALGAQPKAIAQLILGSSLRLVGSGLALGLAGGLVLMRLIQSYLYGVRATDPFTFLLMTLSLLAVALVACLLPVLRSMRLDPMTILRRE